MRVFLINFLAFLLLSSTNSFAFSPEEHLSEPQEQRARELFLQIKCPVCAGQTIESSDTRIAFELRKLVRDKISAGKTDEEIKTDLAAEYGEDILNSPPVNRKNFVLWFFPVAFLLIGLIVIRKYF